MHPVNKVLSCFNVRITKAKKDIPKDFLSEYERSLNNLKRDCKDWNIIRELRYDIGVHPEGGEIFQCNFAANCINKLNPKNILDIGSYREFIIGMLSHYQVTTIDVRERKPILSNETVVTCDAKELRLGNNKFDAVVSLCALEHFGLGRYGDEFDLSGDKKAFKEMVRVVRPGGSVIFTTLITKGYPIIAFNAHKVYTLAMLKEFCSGLICEEEKFYSYKTNNFCAYDDITEKPNAWDIYCGCWRKQ